MELTYSSRKLLRELRKLASSENDVLAFINGDALVQNQDTGVQLDLRNTPGFFGVIDYLVRQGALRYFYEGNIWHVSFTHEGLHPYQVSWEKLKKFVFESMLVPIFVAFITTMLTLLIKGL